MGPSLTNMYTVVRVLFCHAFRIGPGRGTLPAVYQTATMEWGTSGISPASALQGRRRHKSFGPAGRMVVTKQTAVPRARTFIAIHSA